MTTLSSSPASEHLVTQRKVASTGRTRGVGITLVLLGLLNAGGFGLGVRAGSVAAFYDVSPVGSPNAFTVTTQPICFALGGACVLAGLLLIVRPRMRFAMAYLSLGFLATVWCLIMWAQRNTFGQQPFNLEDLAFSSVQYSTIIIFGSISGIMSERSGVVNIAIEGDFLGGAFVGSLVCSVLVNTVHSTALGFLLGGFAGLVLGAAVGGTLAHLSLRYRADQIIVGIVLVSLISGLTNYFNYQLFQLYAPNLNLGLLAPALAIPLLSKIPLLGPAVFDQNLFAYAADVLAIAVSFMLFRTRWGLRVRAVGEHPRAAASVGINVFKERYRNTIIGGAIAGLGGAYFTIGANGQFVSFMTGGLGYIALAAMIIGQWKPYRAVGAALLFGSLVSLRIHLQTYTTSGISGYLLQTIPYVMTIAVVCGLVGRVRPPAADGQPYSPE